MIDSDADASIDLTGASGSSDSSKGHRQNDDIWDLFKKKKLSPEECIKQHRSYTAICKACGTEMHGKPERMKWHIVDCKKADPADQLHTMHKQARSVAGESGSQSQKETPMDRYVDRVRVTPHQKAKWQHLLAKAFIMAGWAFRTVENPQLVDFMAHVRPNFELPSKRLVLQVARVLQA